MPRGKGMRCAGYLSTDGSHAYCTREEHAGRLEAAQTDPPSWAHRLEGDCRCGAVHGAPAGEWTPHGTAVAVYSYVDEAGELLFQVCRTADKQFPQRRPDPSSKSGWRWNLDGVSRAIYRLPQIRAAIERGDTIYVVEGEKDVLRLEAEGLVATCSPGGASKKGPSKWKPDYTAQLAGAREVVVIADHDEAGIRHALATAADLEQAGIPHRTLVPSTAGHDVSDHLHDGRTLDELVPLDDHLAAGGTVDEFILGEGNGAAIPASVSEELLERVLEASYALDTATDSHDRRYYTAQARDNLAASCQLLSGAIASQKQRLERNATDTNAPATTNDAYAPRSTSPSTEPSRRVRLTRIADVTPKRVEWQEEGMIACDILTGLVAPGGTVKGLYGVYLAARGAARGERTLFVCSEDALDYIVRPRFQAAGCDADLAYALSIDTDDGERVPRFPSDLPLLEAAIAEVRPTLVIVDPIAGYIDPGLDMGKNNEMRQILQPLIALARDAHVAILVVYHLGKHRERGALGSVAFEDACRQVLTAARDDDDEDLRHIELTKSNIGPTGYGRKLRIVGVPLDIDGEVVEVAKLVDEGRSGKSVHTLLAKRGTPGPEPEKREFAQQLLRDALVAAGTSGVNADEAKSVIESKAGVSPSTVWRAFTELKTEGLATAQAIRDEYGSIKEWRWVAKVALLVGRNDA